MPQRYGAISKVFIIQDQLLSTNSTTDIITDSNPLSLSLYVLRVLFTSFVDYFNPTSPFSFIMYFNQPY